MDHEGRRGGARAFGRRPTTRAAAWRCLARHALKRTTAVLQPCTVRRSDVLERPPRWAAAAGSGTVPPPPGTGPDFWCSSQPSLYARAPRLSCHSHVHYISSTNRTATGGRAHVRHSAVGHISDHGIMPGAGLQENILMRTAHDTHETTVQRRGGEIPTKSQASRQPPRASVGAVATRGSALAHVGRRHSTLRCPGRFASDRAPRASRARSTSPNVSGHDRSRCHHPHRHGARAERPCDSLLSLYWKGPRLSGFTRAAAHMRP